MKSLLLILSLVVSAALPQIAFAQSRPTEAELRKLAGEYTFDLVKKPKIKRMLQDTLGNKFQSFVADTATSMPSEILDDRYFIAEGCVPHNCGGNVSFFVIDLQNTGAMMVKIQIESQNVFIRNGEWQDNVQTAESGSPRLIEKMNE